MEDYEYSEESCPKCGQNPTHEKHCDELSCENGYIDISEEDYQLEGTTYEKCNTCNGKGGLHWCPKCGYDFNYQNSRTKTL